MFPWKSEYAEKEKNIQELQINVQRGEFLLFVSTS